MRLSLSTVNHRSMSARGALSLPAEILAISCTPTKVPMNSTKPMGTQTFLVKTTEPQNMIFKKDINVKKRPIERKR